MTQGSEEHSFSREEMKSAIEGWLQEHSDLPTMVVHALQSYVQLLDTLDEKSAAMRKLLVELRKSFGIIPKSEKRTNYGTKRSRRSLRASLVAQIEEARAKKRKHARNMRRQDRKSKELEARMKELDEIILTEAEEKAEERENAIFEHALAEGKGRSDPECALPAEALFTGLVAEHHVCEEDCKLTEEQRARAQRTFTEERHRLDIDVRVSTIYLQVEKGEVLSEDGETSIVSASTKDFGPANMNVTWNFLSQISILIGQFGMPMTRLASLVSTPEQKINSERIVRYFHYVAKRLVDVYLHSFQELANSEVLAGDDTSTRTLEVKRYFTQDIDGDPPWEKYKDKESAAASLEREDAPPLACYVGAKLDFVSLKRDKGGGPKRQFNTTLVHGRSLASEPRSTIVFFRSHFGSFGDLVSQILQHRNESNKDLCLVSDLASTNGVRSEGFNIKRAGCAAHARRRFAKAEDGDIEYRDLCLCIFNMIYSNEECLDLTGRNKENVLAVRQRCSKEHWEKLKSECEYIAQKHSSSTSLGEAARYVTTNFQELTTHLDDPRLPHTNDLSERLLRPEKQIQAAALFRNSIEGRTALDVVRTIIQSCSAAGLHAAGYIEWIMKNDPEDVKVRPQDYTPYARAIQIEKET